MLIIAPVATCMIVPFAAFLPITLPWGIGLVRTMLYTIRVERETAIRMREIQCELDAAFAAAMTGEG